MIGPDRPKRPPRQGIPCRGGKIFSRGCAVLPPIHSPMPGPPNGRPLRVRQNLGQSRRGRCPHRPAPCAAAHPFPRGEGGPAKPGRMRNGDMSDDPVGDGALTVPFSSGEAPGSILSGLRLASLSRKGSFLRTIREDGPYIGNAPSGPCRGGIVCLPPMFAHRPVWIVATDPGTEGLREG